METEERHVASLVTCTSACACLWHVNVLAKELRRLLQKDLLWQCEHAVLQRDLHLRELLVRCFSCLPVCIHLSGKMIYFLLERQISAHIAHIILDHSSTSFTHDIPKNIPKSTQNIPWYPIIFHDISLWYKFLAPDSTDGCWISRLCAWKLRNPTVSKGRVRCKLLPLGHFFWFGQVKVWSIN